MKFTKLKWFGWMLAFPLLGYSEVASPPTVLSAQATPPPNNSAAITATLPPALAEVVKLANAGLGDAVVLAYVTNSTSFYNPSSDNILQLKNQGVSPQVISAILGHDAALHGNNPVPQPDYSQKLYAPTNHVQFGQSSVPTSQQADAPPAAAPAPSPQPALNAAPPASAPTVAVAPTIIAQNPPPPQVEVITVAPGPDYYWAPGYWRWNGSWIWVRGGWNYRAGYNWGHRGWGYSHRGWDDHRH